MKPRRLKVVLPPPDHEPSWRRLQYIVYVLGEDGLYRWLKVVRASVESQENEKKRGAA